MIKTQYYAPLGVLCIAGILLIGCFEAAVATGQIALPAEIAWAMPVLTGTLGTISLLLAREEQVLLPGIPIPENPAPPTTPASKPPKAA